MTRILPFVVFAAACTPQPESADLFDIERHEPRMANHLASAAVDVLFVDSDGKPLQDAMACSSEGCVEVDGERVVLPLAAGEVEIVVEGDGIAQQVFAYRAPRDMVLELTLPVDRVGEIEALADAFGTWQDPELATLIQPVMVGGVAPHLDGADGPYFLDANGEKSETLEPGGAFVFFNVEPGESAVQLEVCHDDVLQWGAPRDCYIDLSAEPGDVLRLLPLMGTIAL